MPMPLHTSSGALTSAPLVLIDLQTSTGITGRAYLFAFTRANVKPIAALVEAMGEMIAGDPVSPFEIERKLRKKYALVGVHNIVLIAMSGIDMAAWDAHAQALGHPLVQLLGGTVRPVKACANDAAAASQAASPKSSCRLCPSSASRGRAAHDR